MLRLVLTARKAVPRALAAERQAAGVPMPDPGFAAVLDFLAGGALGTPVERVDTHAAIVLLTPDRAFKLKRPVRYSFLDFTTLPAREAALRHELELNRRTAPELYLRVLPVTVDPDGRMALDGAGTPIEWLLEMRRFPRDAQLDRVLAAGGLSPELVDALADAIAAAQAAAEPTPDQGGAAAMRGVAEGNAQDLRAAVPRVFAAEDVEALVAETEGRVVRTANLLDQRRRQGLVRHCHGDLHLANLVLLDGRPTLFDCIEFDDAIACIDVVYDLAFLIMDLIEKGHREAGCRLLNRWLERTGDYECLALLPLFLSLRAAIRAKVLGLAITQGARGDPAEARRYLAPAHDFLSPPTPCLLAIGGGSGTGKTTLARQLAVGVGAAPGAVILRSDVIRKRLLGCEPTERLPPEAYAPEVSERVFATIAERASLCLAAGQAVIADAVYGQERQRAGIATVATRAGVPFTGIWLEAPAALCTARVAARTGDASDADAAVVARQAETLDQSSVRWHRLRADRPLAAIEAEARALMAESP
ncbi:MAG: AAA family ATPase [Geminicoccaceae bacterium]